jgi:hypothetical protein
MGDRMLGISGSPMMEILFQRYLDVDMQDAPRRVADDDSRYHHKVKHEHSTRIFEVPCVLGSNRKHNALGDSGAKMNFMKEAVASSCGFKIDRTKRCSVRIGSGNVIQTTGSAIATFRFRSERTLYNLEFGLLPDCIHDVILGKPFLKVTSMLYTTFQDLFADTTLHSRCAQYTTPNNRAITIHAVALRHAA